jgi:signal recognition particle GTPase
MSKAFLNCIVLSVLLLAGCAPTVEFSKTIWGSSTRALEKARVNGIVKTYDHPVSRCYDEVLKAVTEAEYKVFIEDKPKATIVIMGIKGSVNTTQVGIFFSETEDNKTKIYVSSLSSNAKRKAAEKIFSKLDVILGSSDSQTVTVINPESDVQNPSSP